MVFTNNPGDDGDGSREARRGIELGQKAQDSDEQSIEWKRGQKAEEMLIEFAKKRHTFTPDDVWNDLFDPAIADGELPSVDNRKILGPMMKRLADSGYVIDTKFITRSTRRNGSPVRVYRTTDLHRNRWLRKQFGGMEQNNPKLQSSLDDLKDSMDRDELLIAELEEILDKAKANVGKDEQLKNRFERSGYNRRRDDIDFRMLDVSSSFGGQFNDLFSFELENESGDLVPLNEEGKYLMNDFMDGFEYKIIIRDKKTGTQVGSISTEVEEETYGATGWALALNPFSDMGAPIGLRISNPKGSVFVEDGFRGNGTLFYNLAQDFVKDGVIVTDGNGNDYGDIRPFELFPYDQRTDEINQYILGIAGDDSEELGISPNDNYFNISVRDEITIERLQKAERFLVEQGLLEDWGGELDGSPFIERELNKSFTTAYFTEITGSEQDSLATFADWYFNSNDPKRRAKAEKILINKIKETRESYKNPGMGFVSRSVIEDLEWSLTKEQWATLLEDPIVARYIKETKSGGYIFHSPEGDGDLDLLYGLLESEQNNIISNYYKRYWQILSARSRPKVDIKEWDLRYDQSKLSENRARDLGVANFNSGMTFNSPSFKSKEYLKKIDPSKKNKLLYRNYDQGKGVVRKYIADGRGRINSQRQAWMNANQLRSAGFYVRSVKMSDGSYLNYRSPNTERPTYRNFRTINKRK
tara:strand:+ start:30851 stop:32947 length:2097 start_codon:yes stop_codon:yes gene_type:complete